MTIVDTTVWIDYLAGTENAQTAWLDRELGQSPIGLTDLILCEVLQGIRDEASFRQVRRELTNFYVFAMGGETLVIASAQNYRGLRARGLTIRKTIDCLIATFCLSEGHSLLHRDDDFDGFERYLGLKVVRAS